MEKLYFQSFIHELAGIHSPSLLGEVGNGNESFDAAAIYDQPALHFAEPLHGDGSIIHKSFLHRIPAFVEGGAPAAYGKLGILVLRDVDHLNPDGIAYGRLFHVLHENPVRPLTLGQKTFTFIAHIHEPTVVIGGHDDPLEFLTPMDLLGFVFLHHAFHIHGFHALHLLRIGIILLRSRSSLNFHGLLLHLLNLFHSLFFSVYFHH